MASDGLINQLCDECGQTICQNFAFMLSFDLAQTELFLVPCTLFSCLEWFTATPATKSATFGQLSLPRLKWFWKGVKLGIDVQDYLWTMNNIICVNIQCCFVRKQFVNCRNTTNFLKCIYFCNVSLKFFVYIFLWWPKESSRTMSWPRSQS